MNEQISIKLEALQLPNGKANTIVKGIRAVLDEYNLWSYVKMIASDTTCVNTREGNGIQLERLFAQRVERTSI